MESVPVVGSYAAYFVFGSDFPGQDFIPRLFVIHVLLVPGILLALISAHMMIIWHQKHTDFPGPGKTEHNVVGSPFFPTFLIKTNGFLMLVFGVCAALGAFAQINPVWLYGPYNPSQVSAGSQPDWYIFFLEGSLRMMPNLESNIWGHTISWNIMIPGLILPGIMFNLLYAYPSLEAWLTKDKAYHNLLQRPRDTPNRTAFGVMGLTFYGMLYLGGQNDVMAATFDWSLQAVTWVMRVLVLVLPFVMFWITKRWCLGLQHHDEELLHHGIETGIIRRLPSGEYIEVTEPLPAQRRQILEYQLGQSTNGHAALPSSNGDSNGHGPSNGDGRLLKPVGALARARASLEGFFFERHEPDRPDDDEPKTLTRP
jgi:ubiquinol-cytochrome c reductase cytochrome b subunit